MQYPKILMIALIGMSTLISCQTNSENQKNEKTMSLEKVADTTVAACKMTEKEQRERAQTLRKELFSKVQEVSELEDGYGLKLPGNKEMFDKVHEHVAIESKCCPFFEFEITMKPHNGPIWLKFKGGKRVKEMLKADVEALKKTI